MHQAGTAQKAQARAAARSRITIDLRGIEAQLQAQAASRGMTASALVRSAVRQMLEADSAPPQEDEAEGNASKAQAVKVTVRMSAVHAYLLARRARRAEVSQGVYLASLIEGVPMQARGADHAQAIAALMSSTDRLAAISADLNAFMRLLGHTPTSGLERYRASLRAMVDDVRAHLSLAAALVAALRAAKGRG